MNVAERMAAARVVTIRLPAVMHTHALVAGKDANGVGGHMPALGMNRVMGQACGARHMRPRQRACPPDAGFIAMEHWRAHKRRLDRLLDGLQRLRALPHPAHQRAQRTSVPSETGAPSRSAKSSRTRA